MRLGHPFPSLLNAVATLALATLAGGAPAVAVRLAGSMLALQLSIGALNDRVDAEADAGRKLGKPIPRGMATRSDAAAIVALGLGIGLALSAASGASTALVAAAGVACGYAYDLRLSRTSWSWLPLAIALPLVPIHAWLGATGSVPAPLLAIVPAGLLAGAALAIANGLADLERDRSSGGRATVVSLGPTRAWITHAAGLAGAVAIALVAAPGLGAGGPAGLAWRGPAFVMAAALITLGAALAAGPGPGRRERGWELEAIGVVVLAIAWLGGVGA